jgi:hypothetical protein
VRVALCDEHDVFTAHVFPILGILSGVSSACGQYRIGSKGAFARSDAITADEDYKWEFPSRASIGPKIARPTGEEVVITLELCRVRPFRKAIVKLDQ